MYEQSASSAPHDPAAFNQKGYVVLPSVLDPATCEALLQSVGHSESLSGGSRSLLTAAWCTQLAQQLMEHPAIQPLLPNNPVAVQCTSFEKSAQRNWLVPVHQDLSIPVDRPYPVDGYSAWSTKEGVTFVQPPLAVLESLLAVRLHLDDCGPRDGPLHVITETHQRGIIPPTTAAQMRQKGVEHICTAQVGGALVMKPLLLHFSSKASGVSKRRVLHFLFGPQVLPGGVQWQQAIKPQRSPTPCPSS